MNADDVLSIYAEACFRFSEEDREKLLAGCPTFALKKNTVVYGAESECTQVSYLLKGKVKYHLIFPDGSGQTTAYAKAPSFLGVMNLLPHSLALNYCTTITSCEICTCPTALFMARLREYNLMETMLQNAIGASRHMYSTLTAIISEDRLKLVDILRNHQQLTLQETADFMGCSRVHVSRICKQIKTQREMSEK